MQNQLRKPRPPCPAPFSHIQKAAQDSCWWDHTKTHIPETSGQKNTSWGLFCWCSPGQGVVHLGVIFKQVYLADFQNHPYSKYQVCDGEKSALPSSGGGSCSPLFFFFYHRPAPAGWIFEKISSPKGFSSPAQGSGGITTLGNDKKKCVDVVFGMWFCGWAWQRWVNDST